MRRLAGVLLVWAMAMAALPALSGAQGTPTPPRAPDEGMGPFGKMVIRGATVIDGSGGTVQGPMDIVIEGNRITQILSAGTPGLPLEPDRPPRDADHEIDATGMYVLPGLVDEHVHTEEGDTPRTYAYKLWLAHGVTTVRGVSLTSNAAASADKQASERNEIVAPRIFNYQTLGSAWPHGPIDSPQRARDWVAWASLNDIDGIKFFGRGPDQDKEILAAAIDEANRRGLGTTMHHSPPVYPEVNAVETGRLGLGTVTHFYGHFESLLRSGRTQPYPPDYNYNDEQSRWRAVAKVIDYTFEPGSPQWWAYLNEQKANGVTFGPTMSVYEAGRDLLRARNLEWHAQFAMPSIWKFWEPNRENHGSFYYDWRTSDEIDWKRFMARYMQLINDYKSIGGRVAHGTDPGYIYNLYGFANVRELEMLQEAGFTPNEAIRAATRDAARTLVEPRGVEPEFGMVRAGMLADLMVVSENPLDNLRTLYGTGTGRLNDETGRIERVGGVRWTIRNGIAYDAKALLADVAEMVQQQKAAGGCEGIDLGWSAAGPCGGVGPGIPPVPEPTTPSVVGVGDARPPLEASGAGGVTSDQTPSVRVVCRLSSGRRAASCTVLGRAMARTGRLRATMRVRGIRRTATRSGHGSVRLTLRSDRRLTRSARVLVGVRLGDARTRVDLRLDGRAVSTKLFAPQHR